MKAKVLMFVVLMSMSAVLFAQPNVQGPMRPFHGQKGGVGMQGGQAGPMAGLNLTDAQKDVFKQSMMAMHKQIQPIRNELREAEVHQKTLMTAEKSDLNAINKNIEKIGALKVEMAKIQAKHRLDMRAQLTDEQMLKLDMFKGKMMPHRGPKAMQGAMKMKRERFIK